MLDKELIPQILADYQNHDIKAKDIEKKYHIDTRTLVGVVTGAGLPLRRPKLAGKRGGAKVCPKCRRKVEQKGAKYCCFCGSDLRSPQELLIEKQEELLTHFDALPSTSRDVSREIILETINFLKGLK